MLAFVLRRVAWAVALALTATLVAFVLFYVVPDRDPATAGAFGPTGQLEDSGNNRFRDTSVFGEYLAFLGDVAQGDLGRSRRTREEVSSIVWRAAPATLSLLAGGLAIWLCLAFAIGVASAMRPRTLLDRAGMVFVLAGISAHPLWLSYVASWFLGYRLEWFPIAGYCDVFAPASGEGCGGPVQWAYHLTLPWLVFASAFAAMYARMIRASLLETMQDDYARTARAKGLSEWSVLRRHTLRNALIPVVTMAGMDVGLAFAGAIFVERAFRIPGIGNLTITSLQRRDLPILLGIVLVVSFAIVVCNLVADLLHASLDPRVAGGWRRTRAADRPRAEAAVREPAAQSR